MNSCGLYPVDYIPCRWVLNLLSLVKTGTKIEDEWAYLLERWRVTHYLVHTT